LSHSRPNDGREKASFNREHLWPRLMLDRGRARGASEGFFAGHDRRCPIHVGKPPSKRLGVAPLFVLDSGRGVNRKPRWMGLAMNNDTNRPDDSDPDDLDGLAASLDYLRLWSESDGAGESSAG
jgi:hypothetical protein